MKSLALAALVALLVGSLVSATTVLSQDRPVPTRLAFLDVRGAFEKYKKREEVEKQLRTRTDALEARFKKEQARIEQAAETLNTMNEGTDERAQLERQIGIDRNTLEFDKKTEARKLQLDARRKEALLYKAICLEAQALAQERGYAAVLLYTPLDADFERKSDLDIFMGTRTAIARDESLDVTGDVVQRLNAQ